MELRANAIECAHYIGMRGILREVDRLPETVDPTINFDLYCEQVMQFVWDSVNKQNPREGRQWLLNHSKEAVAWANDPKNTVPETLVYRLRSWRRKQLVV